MVKLVLLFLLVAVGCGIASHYYEDAERVRDTLSAKLEDRLGALANYYDDADVATYGDDAETVDDDDEDLAMAAYDHNNDAEINGWRRRRRGKPTICACRLEAYSGESYNGQSLIIREQNSNIENMFDDDFGFIPKSIKVKGGCQWLVYSDIKFKGMSYILNPGNYPSTHTWGQGGNEIVSARVLPPRGTRAFVIFQGHYYTNRMVVITNTKRDLSMDFDGNVRSFITTGGKWTLYDGTNLKGDNKTYSGKRTVKDYSSVPFLDTHKIKSIRRRK